MRRRRCWAGARFSARNGCRVLDQIAGAHAPGSAIPARSRRVLHPAAASESTTPSPAQIAHLDGHSTPGIALWRDARSPDWPPGDPPGAAAVCASKTRLPRRPGTWSFPVTTTDAISREQWNPCWPTMPITRSPSWTTLPTMKPLKWPPEFTAPIFQSEYLRNEDNAVPGIREIAESQPSESTFVVLLDADDRIGPNYLFQAAKLLAGGCDVVNPDADLFGATRSRPERIAGSCRNRPPGDAAGAEFGALLLGFPRGVLDAVGRHRRGHAVLDGLRILDPAGGRPAREFSDCMATISSIASTNRI